MTTLITDSSFPLYEDRFFTRIFITVQIKTAMKKVVKKPCCIGSKFQYQLDCPKKIVI